MEPRHEDDASVVRLTDLHLAVLVVVRRRRCSRDAKMRIIEETLAPGAVVTEIALRHGIAPSLLFTWRRRARLATVAPTSARLVPVQVTAAAAQGHRSIEVPAAIPARKR